MSVRVPVRADLFVLSLLFMDSLCGCGTFIVAIGFPATWELLKGNDL